jgi:6-phosphofructokinase 1
MRIAHRFLDKGLPMIGVPKTIDNDLGATDQTFGFDTAGGIAMEALDRLRDTAESHDRVMLVEVMGRDAGWIALHAGLASGADAILVPEIPYRLEPIAKMIERRRSQGQKYSIVVVSEGAKPAGGEASVLEHLPGAMPRLQGAAQRVSDGLSRLLEADMRVTVLGHVQRGGKPTAADRILASRLGCAAVEGLLAGKKNVMAGLIHTEVVYSPFRDTLVKSKPIHPDLLRISEILSL